MDTCVLLGVKGLIIDCNGHCTRYNHCYHRRPSGSSAAAGAAARHAVAEVVVAVAVDGGGRLVPADVLDAAGLHQPRLGVPGELRAVGRAAVHGVHLDRACQRSERVSHVCLLIHHHQNHKLCKHDRFCYVFQM